MISIPFSYDKYPFAKIGMRWELIDWVENNNGKVIRRIRPTDIEGVIEAINFENEEDAIAFRLKFGL